MKFFLKLTILFITVVQKDEFERCVNIDNCDIYNDKVFVMWKWTWLDECSSDGEEDVAKLSDEDAAELSDEDAAELSDEHDQDTNNAIPAITHSVIFKCMGSTKEHEYEEALALAKRKMNDGIGIAVKLEKEPHNPVDAKAIAFVIDLDGTWKRIGYVMSELLEEVHKAMDDSLILKIQVDFIKFIPYFNPI